MILPALTEATSPFFRPIKYSLFPPLGLATLAGYLQPDDEVSIWDEHVENVLLDDEPDLVVVQVYITSARRAYAIADRYRARGVRVALGGLHVTSLPDEAKDHADTIFLGPGEDTWPQFLADLRAGRPASRYVSRQRTLLGVPPIRRDLIKRHKYLVPNSIVVSRGCPHVCDFCYKLPSSRAGSSTTSSQSSRHSQRSTAYPDATCISSTIIFSEVRRSPRLFSTACVAWGGFGRPRARSKRCWNNHGYLRRPLKPECGVCSWALRRSTQLT
jgi:hypothetical protein